MINLVLTYSLKERLYLVLRPLQERSSKEGETLDCFDSEDEGIQRLLTSLRCSVLIRPSLPL